MDSNKTRNSSDRFVDGCACDSRKRTKVPCFPYSPTFHEDRFGLEKKIHGATSWWITRLTYKQLWCAPLQRDAAWEITLHLRSQLWNNATVERYKTTITCWTDSNVTFQSEAIVRVRRWRRAWLVRSPQQREPSNLTTDVHRVKWTSGTERIVIGAERPAAHH